MLVLGTAITVVVVLGCLLETLLCAELGMCLLDWRLHLWVHWDGLIAAAGGQDIYIYSMGHKRDISV
jgi:hypothetical protein